MYLHVIALQRWAHAFRDSEYHAAVDANNGTEAQNKLLKYNFLPRNKQRTNVSSIAAILVEDYLPTAYQKYLLQNYKQMSTYRTYNDFVPEFLRDRPKNTILHCLERMARSNKFIASDIVEINQEKGIFEVTKTSGGKHRVSFGNDNPESMPSCTCQDWTKWNIPCKHFFAVFKHKPEWQWDKLPTTYRQSPYLSTDTEALKTHLDGTLHAVLDGDGTTASSLDGYNVCEDESKQHLTQELPIQVCDMYMFKLDKIAFGVQVTKSFE